MIQPENIHRFTKYFGDINFVNCAKQGHAGKPAAHGKTEIAFVRERLFKPEFN